MEALLPSSTRVIELGDSLAGSYCGHLLLRLGARVIKVEPPQGSPLKEAAPFIGPSSSGRLSAIYAALTVGKEGVTCDLTDPKGLANVEALLADLGLE